MMFTKKHKICTTEGYKEIGSLVVGDVIITSGKPTKITKIIGAKKKKANIIGELKNGVVTYT